MQIEEAATNNLIHFTNISPQKKIAPCEINRWDDTHRKIKLQQSCIKPIKIYEAPKIEQNRQDLKKRKQELLKSTAKKNKQLILNRISNKTTSAKPQKIKKPPLFRITQFNNKQNKNGGYLKIFISPKKNLPNKNPVTIQKKRMTMKKYSLQKQSVQKSIKYTSRENNDFNLKHIIINSFSDDYCGFKRMNQINQKIKQLFL